MGVDDYVIKLFSLLILIVWMKVLYCCVEVVEVVYDMFENIDEIFDVIMDYFKMNMKIWEIYLDN